MFILFYLRVTLVAPLIICISLPPSHIRKLGLSVTYGVRFLVPQPIEEQIVRTIGCVH